MKFYSNVCYDFRRDVFHIREYDGKKRRIRTESCKPYLFVTNSNKTNKSPYRTLDGMSVAKLPFSSRRDMIEFLDNHKDIENFKIYGLGKRPFELIHCFINDEYPGEVKYDYSLLSVVFLDIETDSEGGFPNIQEADKQIIAITVRKDDQRIVLGLTPYKKTSENIQYFKCKDEVDLLEKFLLIWKSTQFSPDIVTGWNIEVFDIPYLHNRIQRILGPEKALELSPFKIIEKRQFETTYGKQEVYHPAGMSILDYLNLYKKFSYTPQESYKLDHIAHMELGEKKLDFRALGYETLDEFYKKDPQNFINYNVKDVDLVFDLENKLKFIEQVCALAYDAKVNLVEAQTTVRMWDIIIHNHLSTKGIVVPYYDPYNSEPQHEERGTIQGAYVKDPIVGMHNWVVSFDLNSLYPHLIMGYNISPETYVDRMYNVDVGDLIEGGLQKSDLQTRISQNNVTFCGSGCMFSRDAQGFLPQLMEKMYNDRVVWKERMIKAKKQYEEIEKEIARRQKV
jgi:DNA polymerase elongation subunit (family B)